MFSSPYKPPPPKSWKVCNFCYQIFRGTFSEQGKEIGPRFDGSTTLVLRPEKDVYHAYNGLHPRKICKLCPDPEVVLHPDGDILPCDPHSMNKFSFIHEKRKNEKELFAKFIIDRITKVAPQNVGLTRKNRYGERIVSKPAHTLDEIVIGGSYPLYLYLRGDDPTKMVGWYSNDLDIFILRHMSLNQFRIRQSLLGFATGEIATNTNWLVNFKRFNVDLVRTTCDNLKEFIDSIDISVVGFFIIHDTVQIPPYLKVIRKVWDDWVLIGLPKAIEDVESNQLTLYRDESDSLYGRTMIRVSKYKDRGFKKVIKEPRELPCCIGSYPFED